jgi:ferredoxin
MKVTVLPVCEAHGQCVLVAPELFDLDDDDNLTWDVNPDESQRGKVERAVRACPVQAITVED